MINFSIRLFSIVTILTVLAGFSFVSMPVSAAADDLSWATLSSPKVTEGTEANVYDIAPDGTIYLYDGKRLNRSVDNGVTWAGNGIGDGLNGNAISRIVINPDNPTSLLACSEDTVYYSTNNGASWKSDNPDISGLSGTAVIKDIDIAGGETGDAVLIAYADATGFAGGVALCDPADGTWKTTWQDTLGTSAAWNTDYSTGSSTEFNALAVAFSPDYVTDNIDDTDHTIVAVAGNADKVQVLFLVVTEGRDWNADYAAATINGSTSSTTIADIAFASDFKADSVSYGKLFLAISGPDDSEPNNVYRVNLKAQSPEGGQESTCIVLDPGVNPASIDFTGPIATGTLAVGAYDENTIYTTSVIATATAGFEWKASVKSPRGDKIPATLVKFQPGFDALYAGTAGAGHSAFSVGNADYSSFSGIAFVSVSDFSHVSARNGIRTGIGTETQFQVLTDDPSGDDDPLTGVDAAQDDHHLLFMSTDSGSTWKMVLDNNKTFFSVYPSPSYDTDQTIWLLQTDTSTSPATNLNQLLRSNDAGQTWSSNNTINSIIPTAFAPVNKNIYWIGYADGIRRSDNIPVSLDGSTPSKIILKGSTILVQDINGEWWYSTDNGATFNQTGADEAIGLSGVFTLGTDGQHYTIYVLDSDYNIQMYTIGVSDSWSVYRISSIFDDIRGNGDKNNINSISISPNGIWYLTSISNNEGQIWRSTDLSSFEVVSGTSPNAIGGEISAVLQLDRNSEGFDVLNTCVATTANATNYCSTWKAFTDTLSVAPVTISPAANAVVTSPVDFSWDAVSDASGYQVQIADDSSFNTDSIVFNRDSISSTTLNSVALDSNTRYYWRVRVATGSPLASPWSQLVVFSTGGPSGYTLTINIYPSGSGSVSVSKEGPYIEGDTIELTATANGGYIFSSWSGDASGTGNRISITMNSNKTVNANFAATGAAPGKIAFVSDRDGVEEIFVMKADGSDPTRLTDIEAANTDPMLSPDGKKIVFQSFRDGPVPEIYIMNANGTEQTRLTNDNYYDGYPVWSPDGAYIVFSSVREGVNDLYRLELDGSSVIRLTENSGSNEQPSCWSPDGTQIVFASTRNSGDYDIYTMNADGSNVRRLTTDPARDFEPKWSPDGTRIAFTSWRNQEIAVFVMNADGTGQTRISSGSLPAWSPDGSMLVFTDSAGGNAQVFTMNADGSNRTRLVNNVSQNRAASWAVENGIPPVVATEKAAVTSKTAVQLKGSLESLGSADDAYIQFQWGTASREYTHETAPMKMTGTGSVSFDLTNLDSNTTYYYRLKSFRQGTAYGQEMNVRTSDTNSGGHSGGGSGGGGGGGSNPPAPAIQVTGLTATNPVSLNTDGTTKEAARYQTADGKLTLDIAGGTRLTVGTGTVLTTLSALVLTSPPAPPEGQAILLAYEFSPEGAAFSPALTLTFSYGTLPEGARNISLMFWNGSAWLTVEAAVDTAKGTVTAQISHFSKYALMYQLPSPANITVTGITITPQTVKPDEKVTIQAAVTNSGGISGSYQLVLKVNGNQTDIKDVIVAGGQTETVSFEVQRGMEGEYSVDVSGQTGKFSVGTPSGNVAEVTASPTTGKEPAPSSPVIAAPVNTSPSSAETEPASQAQDKPTPAILWITLGAVVATVLIMGILIFQIKKKNHNV